MLSQNETRRGEAEAIGMVWRGQEQEPELATGARGPYCRQSF